MTLVRYLIRTLLSHMAAVLCVLVSLLWVFNFLDQMVDVGVGDYTMTAAGIYAISMVPAWLTQFAGMAAFLGALTGLGRLQQDSEIVVMRAAGWSINRLCAVSALAGITVAGTAFYVGESMAPALVTAAVQRKAELRFGPEMSATDAGLWTRDGLRIVGFDRRHARSVTVLTLDEAGELRAYANARGMRRAGPDSIAYDDYRESRITRLGITRAREDKRIESGAGVAALLALSNEASREPTMRQLATRIDELQAAGLDCTDLIYELHDRLARLLVTPLLVVLAVVSVVGPLRSSRQTSRVLLGVVIGFALSMLRDAAHGMVAVFGVSPVVMAWGPAILLIVALVLSGAMRNHSFVSRLRGVTT
jgi:lipopolysaccharide export system permease protein